MKYSLVIAMLIAFAIQAIPAPAQARPSRWCGWYMRTQVHRDPGQAYNLARNWARYGAPAGGPGIGVIVVWPNHVGKIVGYDGKNWIVHSGNDSHAVRTRARSVKGAIAFRTA